MADSTETAPATDERDAATVMADFKKSKNTELGKYVLIALGVGVGFWLLSKVL